MTIQKIASSSTPVIGRLTEKPCANILFRIQALVSRINIQLSRLSEETSARSQTMKKEYRISSAEAASLQAKIGNLSPIISGISLSMAFAGPEISRRFNISVEHFRPLVDQVIPGFGQLFTSHLSARQMRAQSVSSLRQTEIGNEGQKSGEARDLQSELQQLLSNLRELYKKASG
jgi:hypothetical protein